MAVKDPEKNREYKKRHYERNRDKVISEVAERKKRIKKFLSDYKASMGCSRCGERHPACLDLHHVDPKSKTDNKWTQMGWSEKRILREIALCEVLCSNCHRKLHWSDDVSVA